VRTPRSAKAARAEGIVELIDLFPTFCDLADLPAPQSLDGRSFVPLLADPAASGKPAAFCTGANGRTVRTARWRYVERSDGTKELYDHENDPSEYHSLADRPEHASLIREHAALLEQELGPRKIPHRGGQDKQRDAAGR